jgi:hypothetical protein
MAKTTKSSREKDRLGSRDADKLAAKLFKTAKAGSLSKLRKLHKRHPTVNLSAADSHGLTPLHIAARCALPVLRRRLGLGVEALLVEARMDHGT